MPDLAQLIQAATTIGGSAVIAIWLWMMLTDRLVTSKRLDEANARIEKAEKQRDDALELVKTAHDGMRELTEANRAALDWMKAAVAGSGTK